MDTETGYYYLQTRYYDPSIRRFISSDSYDLIPMLVEAGDLNLYLYCSNNPVMNVDPSGQAPQWLQTAGWIGLGVGILICGVAIGILTAGVGTSTLLGAVVVGAAKGALIGAAIGVGAGAIAGGVGAMISGEEFGSSEFWSDVLYGGMFVFGVGALVGAVVGGAYSYVSFGNFASTAKLDAHFALHGKEFNGLFSNATEYAKGAKYTIRHGQKISYMYKGKTTTGYIRFFGSEGKANYAFVGLKGSKAATFGIRRVSDLVNLGIILF